MLIIRKIIYIPLLTVVLMISGCANMQGGDVILGETDWDNEIIYITLLDRFHDGDKSNNVAVDKNNINAFHGGDLKGFSEKFSYLDDFGYTGFLFTPFVQNRIEQFFGFTAYHGYWPLDHFKVDSRWGSFSDLKHLMDLRESQNKSFLIDIVLNHVTYDHPWTDEKPNWFHSNGEIKNWDDPAELTNKSVYGLPDLNHENHDVYNMLMKYTKFWIEKTRPSGIRLDAIKHIPHAFWKKYIKDMKKYVRQKGGDDSFVFLGEYLHGNPKLFIPYIEDGFNAFYNYPLYYTVKQVFTENYSYFNLPGRLQEVESVFSDSVMFNFIDNHDVPRFLSMKNSSKKKMYQALAFLTAIKGVPIIYYGTEENMTGSSGEEGRQSLQFIKTKTSDWIKKLINLRKENKALSHGKRVLHHVDHNVYVFEKYFENQRVLVMFHNDSFTKALKIKLPNVKEMKSVFTERTYTGGDIQLPPSKFGFDFYIISSPSGYVRTTNLKKQRAKMTVTINRNLIDFGISAGFSYYIVGNKSYLGYWDTNSAVPFVCDDKKCNASFEGKENDILEFKIIKKDGDQVVWEKGYNHYKVAKDGINVIHEPKF